MKRNRYNLIDSIRILAERGVKIEGRDLLIKEAVSGWLLGNGCLGRIAFLTKFCGYRVVRQ